MKTLVVCGATASGKTGFAVKKVLQWVLNVFLTLLLIGTISGIIIGATFFNYVKTYLIDEDYDIENLKTSLDQTTTIWYKNENGEYVDSPIYSETSYDLSIMKDSNGIPDFEVRFCTTNLFYTYILEMCNRF